LTALVERHMTLNDVAQLLRRVPGAPGTPALTALLERQTGCTVTGSEAEEMFLALVREAGLPDPEVNVPVAGYEVDFLWRDQRLVVEIDGWRFHSTPLRVDHDHRKDVALRAAGLDVRRFSFWQVTDDPLLVVAGVARGV
jgi:very-short-patch-repair endonuclease